MSCRAASLRSWDPRRFWLTSSVRSPSRWSSCVSRKSAAASTRSGGAYAYIEEAFGPFAGFIASILFWFGYSALSDAAITVAMVEAMTIAFPVLGESIPRAVFIIALFMFLTVVNIKGVKAGVRLYMFNTLAKLVPLLLLLVAGLFAINMENLAIPEWPSAQELERERSCCFLPSAGRNVR